MMTERRSIGALACLCLAACSASSREYEAKYTNEQQETPRQLKPMRIVSMNPCVDSILREVAAPEQIAAISHYSHDPRAASVPQSWARLYPAVPDRAEDVVAMRPDLVIASVYVSSQTVTALQRLGIQLMKVGVPSDVAQSTAQVEAVARLIGREEQGRALVARINTAVDQASLPVGKAAPSALVWQEAGLILGAGTLTDDMLVKTGFESASAARGIEQWGVLSLEDILFRPPAIIMTSKSDMASRATGHASNKTLSHPVLRKVKDDQLMLADLPASMLHCGGPSIIDATERLRDIRLRWTMQRKNEMR